MAIALAAALGGCASGARSVGRADGAPREWSGATTVSGASSALVFPLVAPSAGGRATWAAARKDDELSPRTWIGLAEARWPEQRPKELRRVPEIRSRWGRSY